MNQSVTAFCMALVCAIGWAGDVGTPVTVTGYTKAVDDATLGALVSGRIAAFPIHEGESVKAGDVIVELDKRVEELELARRKLVWESKVELNSAQARVKTLETALAGTRRLFETTKSVSKDELEKQELEHTLAIAQLEQLQVAEEREKIEYEMAKAQVERRLIRSPIGGIVTTLHREVGETCQPHEPLVRVVDTARCEFVGNMDAAAAARVRVGQAATVKVASGDMTITCRGSVSFLSPVVDPASGLQEIKVVFDNPKNQVRPGVTAEIQLSTSGT